ncbi:hypothetical protein A2875_02545 [Candidatus Gottesmanbacteria bacterium RIFCSPHIGHO2_01_FULL_46_14]|uniref:Glycosyltransferase RgtA/B/C/D-like domain-containing protein n=3 Tax=Microgenomates group TaxID=1794810 RepID=A0A1F5ZMR6_9BACT|nr:MAG: Glycosyl transferase family 39 [Candidatus Curtissbacteria bacterium GW2011_GWA1_41_11]OGG13779.1 MAG: hypothetical protein A2875_02545 [Candidatus Gottesmanbacteria bacterium RIFCSPHIGHO2_01_FULL_46_14]OGG28629.1 MAG: hypothetical protein A2971_04820 [Candidatus Gottesmanbacteria bacterium RIFCSPLOWO2_01_FULL_46_21]
MRFKKNVLLVVAVIMIGFAVRFAAVYPGYNPYHPDEPTSFVTAIYMNLNNWKPDRFDYPAGMALIHALVYRNIFIPISLLHLFVTEPNSLWNFITLNPRVFEIYEKSIFGLRMVYAMYWSRYISAFIGSATIILLYVVGKKLFNTSVGLFAAFFLAINHRHVLGSLFGLPDIINAFAALLTLYASVLLLEKNKAKRYVFAGMAVALTFSLKYQPFAALPVLLVHIVWAIRKKNFFYIIGKNAWLAVAAALATFVIINPYYFPNIENAFFRNRQDVGRYQIGALGFRMYHYFYLFHWGVDRLPSVLVVIGTIFLFFKEKLKLFLILAFAGSFIVFMTYFSNGGIFSRNFITPMPYIMLLAAYGFYSLVKPILKSSQISVIIIALLLVLVNVQPIKNVILLDKSFRKDWNINDLANWFIEKLPANSNVRTYQLFFFMNFKGQDAIKNKNINVSEWDYSKGPNSLAEFSKERTDFAILLIQQFQSVTYWWRQFPRQTWLLKYGEVPYDYILESFYGLTLRELIPHTVAEFYKPWQGREFGYLVFKIPRPPISLDAMVSRFRFENAMTLWHPVDPFQLSPMTPQWTTTGKNDTGSMQVPPGGGDATTKVVSDPLAVTADKHYTASGWIKNVTSQPEQEDGFLRIDFYPDASAKTLSLMSMDVAISQRATASGQWDKVEVSAKAPQNARFMTVSFQRKNPAYPYTSYIDNVEVFESTPAPEALPELPEYRSPIKWRDAFYHSFL